MIVISDTSCICYLALLESLEMLPRLYESVLIPSLVFEELAVGAMRIGALEAALVSPWLDVRSVPDSPQFQKLLVQVDAGEAAALALADQLKADLVLMDDSRGRKAALELGLEFTGTVGVLAAAKKAGLIQNIRPLIDRLLSETNFRCSPKVISKILIQAGETP